MERETGLRSCELCSFQHSIHPDRYLRRFRPKLADEFQQFVELARQATVTVGQAPQISFGHVRGTQTFQENQDALLWLGAARRRPLFGQFALETFGAEGLSTPPTACVRDDFLIAMIAESGKRSLRRSEPRFRTSPSTFHREFSATDACARTIALLPKPRALLQFSTVGCCCFLHQTLRFHQLTFWGLNTSRSLLTS